MRRTERPAEKGYVMDMFTQAFIDAGASIVEQITGEPCTQSDVVTRPAVFPSKPVTIIIGVVGDARGQVVFGMGQDVATAIVAAMVGEDADGYGGLAISGIAEFGNILAGTAMANICDTGLSCEITPPTVVWGAGTELAMQSIGQAVTLTSPCGDLDVHVAMVPASVHA